MVESWCFASGILLPRKIRELGHTFVLAAKDPDFYSKYAPPGEKEHPVVALADEIIVCDTNDTGALKDVCGELRGRRSVDGVISSCDYYLKTAATVAEALGLPFNPVNAIDAAINKFFMRVAHREKGLPSPRFALAKSEDDAAAAAREVGLHERGKAVVKPADMNSSAMVRKVDSIEKMKEAISSILAVSHNSRGQERFRGALVEEFLTGEEFSLECCAYKGNIHVLGITDKNLGGRDGVVETGHMFPADISESDARNLVRFMAEALRAIDYTDGVAHAEVRLTPHGPRVIEINPRIGGNYISELVERVKGVNPLTQMIQIALGEEPDCLDKNTGVKSAAVRFIIPKSPGTLLGFHGESETAKSPGVVRYSLSPAGTKVKTPDDNDCYLGYVLTEDREGLRAGKLASEAVNLLTPRISDRFEIKGLKDEALRSVSTITSPHHKQPVDSKSASVQ
jgi:biotin carboxylase